ncbi:MULTISPECIES: DUF6447 family protein [Thiomicrorhabdus]|uniref:Uncharacterized protein n=1 Tax=Thiomicrorhabdus heinhorstiae TaxID=2748010 RepID=A0ABS0BSQ9_9GAMM|nr:MULTISPECIES: DUF6447 family protein [Thiomicrorhabdus]MBF6056878.1 hypothetical protein [Thiomicrorhabdus heinhorstiae]
MAKFTLAGHELDTDTLSEEAKGQLKALQVTEAKIADLQAELSIMQTARNAYARALLESAGTSVKSEGDFQGSEGIII